MRITVLVSFGTRVLKAPLDSDPFYVYTQLAKQASSPRRLIMRVGVVKDTPEPRPGYNPVMRVPRPPRWGLVPAHYEVYSWNSPATPAPRKSGIEAGLLFISTIRYCAYNTNPHHLLKMEARSRA